MLFQYSHLTRESLRFVRILPYSTPESIFLTLEHHPEYFSNPNKEEYTALCYGRDQTGVTDRKPITLHGRSFMVSVTVWCALSAIIRGRNHGYPLESEKFWIDAM